MQRIVLGLEYDGRDFHGWQSQSAIVTVQDALEAALARLAGHPVRVHAAGRTDRGVHAEQQIVHFDTLVRRPENAWVRGVNAHLPAGVAVLWAQPVAEDFHARYAATARHYHYRLLSHPVRPALERGRFGWHHAPLALEAMRAAASCLLGEHDFSSFRSAECQARSPVKILHRLHITRLGKRQGGLLLASHVRAAHADSVPLIAHGDARAEAGEAGKMLQEGEGGVAVAAQGYFVFELSASGFLHHMVRNLMGALIHIGKGAAPSDWMGELLAARDRTRAPPTFMADGLYFRGASYPARFGLPEADG